MDPEDDEEGTGLADIFHILGADPKVFSPIPQDRYARTFDPGGGGAPAPRHPNIAKSEMMDAYKGLWEMVPVPWLQRLPGNRLRNPVDELRASIQSEGVKSPLIINAGKLSRTAQLGEGNHRLEAIRQLGFTHAPARVIVGSEWGKGKSPGYDEDLIPVPNEYFSSDARPSAVFRSLQSLRRDE